MPPAAERNEAFLGRWTVGVVLAVAATVMFVPTILERSRREYRLVVPAGVDLHGVSLKSVVRIGGIESGKVRRIIPLVNHRSIEEADDDGTPGAEPGDVVTGTELVLAIDRGIRLFPGTTASIQREMVSGIAIISIPYLGDPLKETAPSDDWTIDLLPEENPLEDLLQAHAEEDRFNWISDSLGEAEACWMEVQTGAEQLAKEVDETWPALETRGTEVFARLEKAGEGIDALVADVQRLRDDLVAAETEADPIVDAVREDFAAMSEALPLMGERADTAFPRTRAAFSRESERLLSGLHSIEMRLSALRLTANWGDVAADFSLLGGELSRTLDDVVGIAARLLRGQTEADRIQDQIDDLGRDLLAAAEQAREAEANLRAAVASGRIGTEMMPALAESIGTIGELLKVADRIDRAYRSLRLEAIPARPAPAP